MTRAAAGIPWRLGVFLAALVMSSAAAAQRLEHVREFDFMVGGPITDQDTGDLQFVPGGYVIKDQNGHKERYIFRGNSFQRFKGKLSPALEKWSSFDWDVDAFDEIDLRNSKIRKYLPKGAKLKKVLEIPPEDGGKPSLSVVCYTIRTYQTSIFITALLSTATDGPQQGRTYRKLWTLKPKERYSYGDFQYQLVPGAGGFVLLYSGAPGADSQELSLDVYRLHWDEAKQKASN